MNCEEARRHWSLYHDSEGDPELYVQINDHLADCPQCAEWFHQESHLEVLLADELRRSTPTPELWQSVLHHAGLERPQPARRWMLFGGIGGALLALAASLLIAVWLGGFASQNGQPDLARLTAAQHGRLATGEMDCEFTSGSDLDIENYLRSRVSFPVRCPPRNDTGFVVQGAGVSQLGGQDTAYVFGHVDGQPISVFILSRDSLAKFPAQQAAVHDAAVHQFREGAIEMVIAEIDQNLVLVVGPVGTQPLTRVLKAYGTYPHGEHNHSRA